MAARKVGVLDDAHCLSEQAQNALLKTLEEPPGAPVLVLVASSAALLLPTVRSRCQVVRLDPLPAPEVVRVLEASGVPAEQANQLAPLAEGSPGRALALAGEAEKRARALVLRDLPRLRELGADELSRTAQELSRGALDAGLATALAWYRDALETALVGDGAALRNPAAADDVRRAARRRCFANSRRSMIRSSLSRRTPTACSPSKPCSSRCARSSVVPARARTRPHGRAPGRARSPRGRGPLPAERPDLRLRSGSAPPPARRSRAGGDRARPRARHGGRPGPLAAPHPRPPARHQEGRLARPGARGPEPPAGAAALPHGARAGARPEPRDQADQGRVGLRREQGHLLLRGRGAGRPPRPGARAGRAAAHARRDEADRRARRDQSDGRGRAVRARAVLLLVAAGVPAGVGQDGEGAGPVAQPLEARRHVRAAQVLPALRVPDVRRA